MAEGILFDTLGKILEALGSQALEEVAFACNLEAEIRKLKDTVFSIKAVLLDAENQYSKKNHQVTEWLRRLKDAVYDADDLLDDFFTELKQREVMMPGNKIVKQVCICFSTLNQAAYSRKMGRKIKSIRHQLDRIKNDRKFNLIEHHHDEKRVDRERETHSFVREEKIIGRDDDKKAIIELLLNTNDVENVSVIPIVGIGGLGKTTLAQLVYNDERVINNFELRMWVCVSDEFDVKIIIEQVIKSASGKGIESHDMDQLQTRLRGEIGGRRYLLVLDDVWNENRNKWSALEDLLTSGEGGSKILVTTRSERVAKVTSKLPFYVLNGLTESQSWSLFTRTTFEQGHDSKDSRFEVIGKDIVAKCVGIPLAIKTIGRLLYDNNSVNDWLHFRDNELSKMGQEDGDILPILKLSYDHLPSHLKQCFGYCALFPKDCKIEKQKLIKLWMAQGFLHSSDMSMEDVGDRYFMNLFSRSFFQDAKYDKWGDITTCKMHDLMHDLAQLVAGTECSMATLGAEVLNERARHLSFDCNLYSSWEIPSACSRADHVRTFLLPFQSIHADARLNESDCQKILSNFPCLRILDLSKSGIAMLPGSIGKLKHLRCLDLSYNNHIKNLPNSMSRLVNLQTLDLSYCSKLKELPRGIRKMVSLRHLVIEECFSLIGMPSGLGWLTSLRTLPLFIVSRSSRELGELQPLNNLRGELTIKIKLQSKNDLTPVLAILEGKKYLQSLTLEWQQQSSRVNDDELLLQGLQPHVNLKALTISWFGGVVLPSWLSSLTNLTTISLFGCMKCQQIPPLGQLPSLKSLYLFQLNALMYISDQQSKTSSLTFTTTFFPSLRELEIYSCPKLKGWWRSHDDDSATAQKPELPSFPCLSKLVIGNCPNLTSLPLYPSLEELILSETSSKPLQQAMKTCNNNTEPSTSSSFCAPLSKLKSVLFDKINDIESPPGEWLRYLTSVLHLGITSCPILTSQLSQGIRHLSRLETMVIGDCDELDMLNDEDDKQCQWEGFRSLRILQFLSVPTLVSLPRGLQHVTTLKHLSIDHCPNFMVLPEWICHFKSLTKLEIDGCHNLKSLPKGMRLHNLHIARCPELSERYGNSMAVHWSMISHISNIQFDWQWIQLSGRYLLNLEGCFSPYRDEQ